MAETSLWDGIAKPWIELNNTCWNFVYENTFGRLTQIPLLGSNRGFNQQLMQALDAWVKTLSRQP